jgi:hypothetical protein
MVRRAIMSKKVPQEKEISKVESTVKNLSKMCTDLTKALETMDIQTINKVLNEFDKKHFELGENFTKPSSRRLMKFVLVLITLSI